MHGRENNDNQRHPLLSSPSSPAQDTAEPTNLQNEVSAISQGNGVVGSPRRSPGPGEPYSSRPYSKGNGDVGSPTRSLAGESNSSRVYVNVEERFCELKTFSSGKALGGPMRRHPERREKASSLVDLNHPLPTSLGRIGLVVDLNLPLPTSLGRIGLVVDLNLPLPPNLPPPPYLPTENDEDSSASSSSSSPSPDTSPDKFPEFKRRRINDQKPIGD